jgi:nucleoid DNA-binding protein
MNLFTLTEPDGRKRMFVGYDTMNKLSAFIRQEIGTGRPVRLRGIGTFSVIDTHARKGRNPRTGEEIDIPAGKRIKFTPAAALKAAINNGADHA